MKMKEFGPQGAGHASLLPSMDPSMQYMTNISIDHLIEFFINSPHYTNANTANLVLVVPLEMSLTNEVCYLEI